MTSNDMQDERQRNGHKHGHISRKVVAIDEWSKYGLGRGPQPVKAAVPGKVLDERKGGQGRAKNGESIGQP